MKQNSWTRAAIGVFVLIILTVFILHSHQAHATFTATGTSLTGDSNSTIDATGTLGIGNTNTTSITIGQIGQSVTFPGNLILSGITGSSQCLQVNSSGQVSGTGSACGSGGSGSPAGSNTQIQFNNSGAFGASANLTWASPALTIGNAGSTTGQLALAGATSGTTTLQPAAAASGTLTLPAATGSIPYYTGSPTSGNCVSWGSSGLLSDSGSACSGGGSVSSGLAGQVAYYAATGASLQGDTNLSHANNTLVVGDSNGLSASQLVTTGSLSQIINTHIANAPSTGTSALLLAKINSSGNAIKASTGDTADRVYPVASAVTSNGVNVCTPGTSGNACLVISGQATLTFDAGGGTGGDYVGESTTTAGDAADFGSSVPNGTYCVGKLLATVSGGAAGTVNLGDCPAPVYSAIGDPGSNGIVYRSALNTTRIATESDIALLFSAGSSKCYLFSNNGTGGCDTPPGTGTVTNTSGPLTSNAVVIGNGGSDETVASGFSVSSSGIPTSIAGVTTVGNGVMIENFNTPYTSLNLGAPGTTNVNFSLTMPGGLYKVYFVIGETASGSGGTCSTNSVLSAIQLAWTSVYSNGSIGAIGNVGYYIANTSSLAAIFTIPNTINAVVSEASTPFRLMNVKNATYFYYTLNVTTASNCTTPPTVTVQPIVEGPL